MAIRSLLVFAMAAFASPVLAQAPTPGELSPSNQDADMRPTTQSMQTIGEHSDQRGVDAQGPSETRAAGKTGMSSDAGVRGGSPVVKPPKLAKTQPPAPPDPESKVTGVTSAAPPKARP